MSATAFSRSLRAFGSLTASRDPLTQCIAPRFVRTMATEAVLPNNYAPNAPTIYIPKVTAPTITTTIYKFPSMEPSHWASYDSKHLHLPLRKDILHRAVIFEGDATRQGTAHTKNRHEVHGSHRKMRPQKGLGAARLGTRQSPTIRGGGKTFGARHRDFSTELPRKMYDLAWRTALSWRYRRGELVVCADGMEIEHGDPRFLEQIYARNRWDQKHGRTLLVTKEREERLWGAMEKSRVGKLLQWEEVDVKDLLEMSRVVIEQSALDRILADHQSDLGKKVTREQD